MKDLTTHNSIQKQDAVQAFFDNFNIKLFTYIVRKSLLFIIILLILCFLIPYVYIRYSIPVYETNAALIKRKEIKNSLLDEKSTEFLKSNDEEKINRDIQIIKSDYLLNTIMDSFEMGISYFVKGRLFFNKFEFNGNNQFKIASNYKIYNPEIFGSEIEINFLDNSQYNLSYKLSSGKKKYSNLKLNQPFKNADLEFTPQSSSSGIAANVLILFNSHESIKEYIINQINITNSSPNIYFNIKSVNNVKSEKLLDALINGFIHEDTRENSEKVEKSLIYIKAYLDTLNMQLNKSQAEKASYSIQNNIYAPESQLSSTLSELQDFKIKIDEASQKLKSIERTKSAVNSNLTNTSQMGNSYSDPELNELILEKNKLLLDYRPNHPTILHVNKQIQDRVSAVDKSIRNEISDYRTRLSQIQNQQAQSNIALTGLPIKDMEFNRIQKELEIKEKYVYDLLEKQIQYLIIKSSISSDYLILQPPKTKPGLVSPKKPILYILGAISFFLIGILIVFFRYLNFDKIVSVEEIKNKINIPILGYIPFVKEGQVLSKNSQSPESRLVVLKNSKSKNSEIFKKIRASMKYTGVGDYKTVASTSTVSGEGKTFVLINLAAVHALLDKKVIIIDLDLRKPRISKSFQLDNHIGMSNILSGQAILSDAIQKNIIIPNLDIITSGPIPPNPSELITSEKFNDVLEELKKSYDYIFIDTPPIGLVNESIEIINKVDIPLYIIRFNYSKKEFLNVVDEMSQLKKGTSPMYLIVNHFGVGASSYINYQYGGYSYKYGYSKNYSETSQGYYTEEELPEKFNFIERVKNYFNWKL